MNDDLERELYEALKSVMEEHGCGCCAGSNYQKAIRQANLTLRKAEGGVIYKMRCNGCRAEWEDTSAVAFCPECGRVKRAEMGDFGDEPDA